MQMMDRVVHYAILDHPPDIVGLLTNQPTKRSSFVSAEIYRNFPIDPAELAFSIHFLGIAHGAVELTGGVW